MSMLDFESKLSVLYYTKLSLLHFGSDAVYIVLEPVTLFFGSIIVYFMIKVCKSSSRADCYTTSPWRRQFKL